MTRAEKIIKPKLGLLALAKELGNISLACKTMGYIPKLIQVADFPN